MTDKKHKKEIEEVKKQAEEYLAGWKRAKADYINLQRETEQKISSAGEYIKASILIDILPVYDNLKSALAHLEADSWTPPHPDPLPRGGEGDDDGQTSPRPSLSKEGKMTEDFAVGIKHIKKQFEKVLADFGIEEIKTVGEKFDPEMHEAVETVEDETAEEGKILEEISAGYRMNGKVIRPARVRVAK